MDPEDDSRSADPDQAEDHPDESPERHPGTEMVRIDSILPGDSPRLIDDEEHARRLAETEAALPPILVHRGTMRIIDGMHRLKAAIMKGQKKIEVIFFDGSEEDAFIRAVEENVSHGLPLSLGDRKMAAVRIMESHPRLSDRAIAMHTGLAAKTVGALRRRSTTDSPQLNARIGADGRLRPLNSSEGRLRASEVIANLPGASLREIARISGISVGTAHDVRQRISRGESPVPAVRQPDRHQRKSDQPAREFPESEQAKPLTDASRAGQAGPSALQPSLQRLMKDPALRHTDLGRELLRMLHRRVILPDDWSGLIDAVPAHCTEAVIRVARQCAENWEQLAQELERRGDAIG